MGLHHADRGFLPYNQTDVDDAVATRIGSLGAGELVAANGWQLAGSNGKTIAAVTLAHIH